MRVWRRRVEAGRIAARSKKGERRAEHTMGRRLGARPCACPAASRGRGGRLCMFFFFLFFGVLRCDGGRELTARVLFIMILLGSHALMKRTQIVLAHTRMHTLTNRRTYTGHSRTNAYMDTDAYTDAHERIHCPMDTHTPMDVRTRRCPATRTTTRCSARRHTAMNIIPMSFTLAEYVPAASTPLRLPPHRCRSRMRAAGVRGCLALGGGVVAGAGGIAKEEWGWGEQGRTGGERSRDRERRRKPPHDRRSRRG